ncbi:MAG: hypothetical protein NTZ56_16170 [Acidobacteria bacterium]|nr:hypothetical protein [Acidobacteriota bacterium]
MAVADANALALAKQALEAQQIQYVESDDPPYMTKLACQHGLHKATLRVSNKGNLDVQGGVSPLKEQLQQIVDSLKSGVPFPAQLPADIDQLIATLKQQVPNCDPVICAYIEEAIRCYKADALLSCAFVLGAASEKAMGLLVQAFGAAIGDAEHRAKYESKTNRKMISVQYDEFVSRFKSCKSKPTNPPLNQDVDTMLGTAFQFYRMTRNEVGHPEIVPNLAKPVLHANIAQMTVYLERIYGLIAHFQTNGVVL